MRALVDEQTGSAVISECGRYSYLLTSEWGPGDRTIAWVMSNPCTLGWSTAEPTVRLAAELSRRWGYDRLEVVNLFAYRATHPEELALVDDPVGPENRRFVRRCVTNAEIVVVAWGEDIRHARSRPETLDDIVSLRRADTAMLCFGLTESGQPLHPRHLHGSVIPVVWPPP